MNNNESFEINKTGKLTQTQKRFLYKWLFYRIAGLVVPGLLIGAGLKTPTGWLIFGLSIALGIFFVWQYGTDIWQEQPATVYGRASKQKMRTRGPAQHYLIFPNETRIRAEKSDWDQIEEYGLYRAYFTKRTKWLLSYTRH